MHKVYGCVKCHRWHWEGSENYKNHLSHQSERGISYLTLRAKKGRYSKKIS